MATSFSNFAFLSFDFGLFSGPLMADPDIHLLIFWIVSVIDTVLPVRTTKVPLNETLLMFYLTSTQNAVDVLFDFQVHDPKYGISKFEIGNL